MVDIVTALQHCYEEIAPPFSDWFYALKGRSLAQLAPFIGALVFANRVQDIPHRASEHALALTQLNWWQAQLLSTAVDDTRHPALQLMLPHLSDDYVRSRLQRLLDLAHEDLDFSGFATQQDARRFFRTRGAVHIELLARLLGTELPAAVAADMGEFIEYTQLLKNLTRYSGHGLVYFAIDELADFQLKGEHFVDATQVKAHEQNIGLFLHAQSRRVEQAWIAAERQLSRRQRIALLPLLRWLHLQQLWLNKTAKDGFALYQYRLELGALQKRWSCARSSFSAFLF